MSEVARSPEDQDKLDKRRMIGTRVGRVFLVAPLVLAAGCGEAPHPAAESADTPLVVDVPSTDQRPYTLSLPEGWSVEETVHPDGSSFVLPPLDHQGEAQGGGKVYGVVEPSGRIVSFTGVPGRARIRALEADGSQVSVSDAISVDGHAAWEILVSQKEPARLTIMVGIDMGEGAGCLVILTVPGGADSASLLKSIVQSIRINEAQLSRTLAAASPP